MACVTYLASVSADGFMADRNLSLSWMVGAPAADYGFKEFYDQVDVVILGRNTFDYIMGMGGAENFPYQDKELYVVTSEELPEDTLEFARALSTDEALRFVAKEKLNGNRFIWVGGGAKTAALFLDANLLDKLELFLVPILLGEGLSFASGIEKHHLLKLDESEVLAGGVVKLCYQTVKPTAIK